jgi:hypothetical protein
MSRIKQTEKEAIKAFREMYFNQVFKIHVSPGGLGSGKSNSRVGWRGRKGAEGEGRAEGEAEVMKSLKSDEAVGLGTWPLPTWSSFWHIKHVRWPFKDERKFIFWPC